MDVAVKRRKVIDIPEDVFRFLSIKAAAKGTNLKRYIENLLAEDANRTLANMTDADAYKWLSDNEPDGHIMVGKKEKADFENWLGVRNK